MAKNTVYDWSSTAASNTDVGGIGITGNSLPSNLDDAQREMMAQIKSFVTSLGLSSGDQVARLGSANTFTANQTISGTGPFLTIEDTSVTDLRHRVSSFVDDLTLDADISNVDPTAGVGFRIGGSAVAFLSRTQFNVSGSIAGLAASATVASFNRTGSDGTVVSILNDGSQVGSISMSGTTTAYNTTSDERLKQDFQPIDPELVDAIHVYDFKWASDGTRSYGVKAQELYDVVPRAVTIPEGEDASISPYWSVDYSKLVPILISSVKDLRERIAALEAGA